MQTLLKVVLPADIPKYYDVSPEEFFERAYAWAENWDPITITWYLATELRDYLVWGGLAPRDEDIHYTIYYTLHLGQPLDLNTASGY